MPVSKVSTKALAIKEHLCQSYPKLTGLFEKSDTLECLKPSELIIPSALTRIVVGQMLSARAADTIYNRVKDLADLKKKQDWKLEFEEYRTCGLSRTKAGAIVNFAGYYAKNKNEVENWKNLESEQLIEEIIKHKGIGRWTATIMALFHFGREDIYPELDGALQRVTQIIEEQFELKLDPDFASPYRSYLAYYFWHFLDKGIL